tara:strand:+ start:1384 stop:1971 length:588 start_codon:yes stop_codon:yes gene_type:complete
MKVLILSKTRYGNNSVCIGGLVIENNQYVRLLDEDGDYQQINTEFKIGEIWNISFIESNQLTEPHNEDIKVQEAEYVEQLNDTLSFLKLSGIEIWENNLENSFERNLSWTGNGSGYITKKDIPTNSVGFWTCNEDLKYDGEYYLYKNIRLKYKGLRKAKNIIAKGTLIRLSLAKWWNSDGEMEDRCYLQLSGWYD